MKPLALMMFILGIVLLALSVWITIRIDVRHHNKQTYKRHTRLVIQYMLFSTLGGVVFLLALAIDSEKLTTPLQWIGTILGLLCFSSILAILTGSGIMLRLEKWFVDDFKETPE